MELYIHIPFCVKKCNYCDFLSFPIGERGEIINMYIDGLCKELNYLADNIGDIVIDTIFIGGGTPSAIDVSVIEELLSTVKERFNFSDNIEYTIECNPGTLTEEKLLLYKRYGINRLSIGLQSDNNTFLKELGRIHTYGRFLESYCMARNAGFDNINIDLISAIPGQTKEEWERTLRSIVSLEPEHISAYSLIIEEGTPLYEAYEKNPDTLKLPNEDDEREMYHITKSILEENGYLRYEISNYAKIGKESRHNLGYWTGEEYYGAGLGASSYLNRESYLNLVNKDIAIDEKIIKVRFKNSSDFDTYMLGNYENVELLNVEDCISEFCILGLRTVQGLSKEEFRSLFGLSFDERFGEVLKKYKALKLMDEKDSRVFFTEEGFDVSNAILVDFMN